MFVGNRVRSNELLMWWAAVYGYPSSGTEWHRTLYTNCAYLLFFTLRCFIQNTQVAPTLHPPLNITTSNGPINWTVSFVRDSQIFRRNTSHWMMIRPMDFPFSSHSPTHKATRGRGVRYIAATTLIPRALTQATCMSHVTLFVIFH